MIIKSIFAIILFALPYGLPFAYKFIFFTPLFLMVGANIFGVKFAVNLNIEAVLFFIVLAFVLFVASYFASVSKPSRRICNTVALIKVRQQNWPSGFVCFVG